MISAEASYDKFFLEQFASAKISLEHFSAEASYDNVLNKFFRGSKFRSIFLSRKLVSKSYLTICSTRKPVSISFLNDIFTAEVFIGFFKQSISAKVSFFRGSKFR